MNFLADKYLEGENTYVIEEDDKLTNVIVTRIKYTLSMEALEKFKAVHDEWELKVCEKFPFDSLIGGIHFLKITLHVHLQHIISPIANESLFNLKELLKLYRKCFTTAV